MSANQFIESLTPHRREHWMILCLLAYAINGVLKYFLPSVICNIIATVSGFGFLVIIIKHFNKNSLRGFTGFVYGFLVLWSLALTFRMFFIDDVRSTFQEYHGLTTWLLAYFGSNSFLPNMLPLFLLAFPENYKFDYKYLWRVMWLLCILFLCYYPFAYHSMINFQWSKVMAAGEEWGDKGTYGDFITNSTIGIFSITPVVIMIYFKEYLEKKQWIFYLIAFFGSALMTAYMARRGNLALSALYLVLAWLVYALYDKNTSKLKLLLISGIVIYLGYSFISGYADTFFSTLSERGDEDTRSGVEIAFYLDMQDVNDWIFGRGWFGQYYDFNFREFRSSIETGYLALILRGGFMYLIPYVVVLLMSFYNGFFRSKNLFCKSFAILCIMQVLSLYPWGWPQFNFLHYMIWLGVWICNNKLVRGLDNLQISYLCFK